MNAKNLYIIFFCILGGSVLPAQVSGVILDSLLPPDSILLDSLPPKFAGSITISKDSIDAEVTYKAADSMYFDVVNQRIHLYGKAEVTYKTITLKAGYIVFDWKTNIVTAEGILDSAGQEVDLPVFNEAEQTFDAHRMRYNFRTKKGIAYEVTTKQNDIFVHGAKAKFVANEIKTDTSTRTENILYNQRALFTTCDADEPHFGIRSSKQKFISEKLVVLGPSNLEIMGVPTPLFLPFGFFPVSKGRQTGLMFPRDYEYSPLWGFGLREIGWYFPLGEHFNLIVSTDLYLKGTWGLHVNSQYRKRYKYNGSFNLGYDKRKQENSKGEPTRSKSLSLQWSHSQDAAAHPTARFGGSINIQTNDYQQLVYNDARNVLQNQLSSNLNFSKSWTGKPYTFSASFNHSQNTATSQVTINFPNVQFLTQTLYPFRAKKKVGTKEWYEDITFRYSGSARNTFQATDTTLFQRKTLQDAQFGVRHDMSSGTSFKIFKYFNLNPSITYNEVWYLNTIDRQYLERIIRDTIITANNDSTIIDTEIIETRKDTILTNRINQFKAFRQFTASLSLNTQIFGTMRFSKGWLRGLRHVVKPSISMNFSPDYLNAKLGYYQQLPDVNDPEIVRYYSIFERGIFGSPPQSGQQMGLSYSINNIFEAKTFSKADSTLKNVKLFDNIYLNGSYNFAADSLKWSPVNASGTARLFGGMTTFSFGAQFDPYILNAKGIRIDRTVWRDSGKLLRFVNAGARFNTSITFGKLRALLKGEKEEVVEDLRRQPEKKEEPEKEDFLSLFENFSIGHNIAFTLRKLSNGRDTLTTDVHSIDIRGSIRLSKYWSIDISNIDYNFVYKSFSYPSLGFSRDLHCWEMGMNWQPVRGTYAFYIRVKPGTLDFLKIPYTKNRADAFSSRR